MGQMVACDGASTLVLADEAALLALRRFTSGAIPPLVYGGEPHFGHCILPPMAKKRPPTEAASLIVLRRKRIVLCFRWLVHNGELAYGQLAIVGKHFYHVAARGQVCYAGGRIQTANRHGLVGCGAHGLSA